MSEKKDGFDFDRMRDPNKSENPVEEHIARQYQGEEGPKQQEVTQNFVEWLAWMWRRDNPKKDEDR